MRSAKKTAAYFITLLVFLSFPGSLWAETILSVTGISALAGNNKARAEQIALHDAFFKAYFELALKLVPGVLLNELTPLLPEYVSSRGMQDIIQYQPTSRVQQSGVLHLSVDIRLNEGHFKEWLSSRNLTAPTEMRPGILFMISYPEQGKTKPFEWWEDRARPLYSPFESQLGQSMKKLGQKVIEPSQKARNSRPELSRPMDIARSLNADFLLTGDLRYTPAGKGLYECSLKVTLMDARTQSAVASWAIAHRGDFPLTMMFSLMIDELMPQLRPHINGVRLGNTPTTEKKLLCIEGISNYTTYQSFINAVKSTGSVSKINITSISGHSICHILEIKGSLSDLMENLKSQKIAEADILVQDDKASIRIMRN